MENHFTENDEMKTGMQIKGTVTFEKERNDGTKVTATYKNLAMHAGALVKIAALIGGTAQPANMITHLAMGTGHTQPTESDTALETESLRSPCVATIGAAPNDNVAEFKVAHAIGTVDGIFEEAGLFDAGTGGSMFNRSVFTPFPVTTADTLTVIWKIEIRNI